jgi:hypothetical protein
MANSEATAKKWMAWLLEQHEIPFRLALSSYFANPTFGRFCDCGCNSFDLLVPDNSDLPALCTADGTGGMFFEIDFALRENRQLEFLFFCDRSGRLNGVDVEISGNNFPVPDTPVIGKVVNIWASPSLTCQLSNAP